MTAYIDSQLKEKLLATNRKNLPNSWILNINNLLYIYMINNLLYNITLYT